MHSHSCNAPTHDGGGTVNHRSAFGALWAAAKRAHVTRRGAALVACLFAIGCHSIAAAQTLAPAGTVIRNTASVSYSDTHGRDLELATNEVALNVVPRPSLSELRVLRATSSGGTPTRAAPTQCRSSSAAASATMRAAVSMDVSQPLALLETKTLHGGEPMFIRVTDTDRNRDATVIDTIEVQLTTAASDRETLVLAENDVDSGVFIGFVQTQAAAAVVGNCMLEVERNAEVVSVYTDPTNDADTSSANVLVDPFGLIFDSSTGAAVNGARVRLLNAATGTLATVFGDDGVSAYPAEMVTGTNVTDAGGTVYALPAGMFRFPLLAPGSYRLEVVPPAGHAFPSSVDAAELAQISGAPFRLSSASFGAPFTVEADALAVDLPIDPAATQLFMQKTTPTTVAAIGDFVQYTLTIQNTSTNAATSGLTTIDRLPTGMRYRAGSTRVDGEVARDPIVAADGATLTFTTDALGPNQQRQIRYVAEITAGARGKRLVNAAQTIGADGVGSNAAQATIELREELFRDRAIVMGRIVEGSCSDDSERLPGVAGVRVYLEDGRYSVTDEEGKYHFEGVVPGAHVVQIDTLTLPDTHRAASCADRVRHAGRAYSQFIDVRGGALWRSDFVIERKPLPKGTAMLGMQSEAIGPATLQHTLTLDVQHVSLANARVLAMLPEGVSYVPSSLQIDGKRADDPRLLENTLSIALATVEASRTAVVTFRTEAAKAASGALAFKAVAMFDSPGRPSQRTEPVQNIALRGEMLFESASYRFTPRFDVLDTRIQANDRAQLDRIVKDWQGVTSLRLTAIGHSDALLIASHTQRIPVDNDALSRARAQVVASYLAQRLGIEPDRVAIEGRGSDEPLVAGHDAKSLAQNRRVEISIEGLRVVASGAVTLKTSDAQSARVATIGVLQEPAPAAPRFKPLDRTESRAEPAAIDIEQLSADVAWVLPLENDIPAIPAIKVAVQHPPTQQVELRVNGVPVSPLNYDGMAINAAKTVALSRWRSVGLRDGDNEIVALVRDHDGIERNRITRKIHYAGGAVRAELVREASTLIADGRTHPVIALRMIDAHGESARPGTLGAYRVEAPYRSWWEVQARDDNKLVATGTREPTFAVGEDGIARLELEPTTQAGSAVIQLRLNERQSQEIRVWLEPRARDWILVGIAEGTAAYRTISDNMQAAQDAGLDAGYADAGRIAFFAKGAIKGEFLLTAAYDSARERSEAKERLLGVIEPDRFYALYGDATEQRFEAATARKLYLKLERRQFAAMFGDFETGLTVTELSRYSRTMTGFKSDYAGEHFGFSAFAAQSDQGFVKDEIAGDGTSGLYRLSRRPLIVNSDKIRIEVRDRFRSEVIVESRSLTRYLDYSIDYLNGTLFFKQPVPSRDASFNPVLVVAEYEVIDGGKEEMTAGGRASLKLADDKLEIGASYIQENAAVGATRVAGTDLRWQLGAATELKAELAHTQSDLATAPDSALGYLTELTHVSEKLDARAYVREQELGFGVGQQMNSEDGTRKLGIDGRFHLTERTLVEGEAYRQEMLSTGAQRDLLSAEVRREADDYTLGLGARQVEDAGARRSAPSSYAGGKSQQAFVNGSVDLFDDRITLHAAQDVALGDKASSVDFPNRTLVGLDYHLSPETTLFAEYERADGAEFDSDMTRIGLRATPWERAQLQSSMTQELSEFGPRVFANVGLTQSWQATQRWTFDFGVDQSKTVSGAAVAPFNPNLARASGTLDGDFLAAFAGATYRSELWMFTSRIENRDSDDEDRLVFAGGFFREPLAGHGLSLATQFFDSEFANGSQASAGEVQLGWVYRPAASRWIVLDRLDLKHEETLDAAGRMESARIINNFNANWQLDPNTQTGLQLGARYVRSTFEGERYSGTSALIGIDLRRDLNPTFDIGVHGTMLSSLEANVSDHSFGLDLGMTLVKNVWISLGYNFTGFRDDDFEASRYLAQGPYIKFRMKADQETFKDVIGAFARGERGKL